MTQGVGDRALRITFGHGERHLLDLRLDAAEVAYAILAGVRGVLRYGGGE